MAITLKQLAKELGLNDSTVSYALSGKGSINEATRQRVREAAQRLGYVPNALARRVRTQRSNCLGLVLPDSVLQYNEIIQQLYRVTAERDFELQMALTEFNERSEERAINVMMESRVDGMIIRSRYGSWDAVPEVSALRRAAAARVPIVNLGWNMTGSPFSCLELPLAARSAKLARHLLELGHRHFACLIPTDFPIYGPYVSMIRGVQQVLEQAGLPPEDLEVMVLDPAQEAAHLSEGDTGYGNYLNEVLPSQALGRGERLLLQTLQLNPRPTALLCYNEVIAVGALRAAMAQGLRVPQDVSIVATHRSMVAEMSPLPLTTCDVKPLDVATSTLSLLMDVIEGNAPQPVCRTLEPELIVGTTSGAAPGTSTPSEEPQAARDTATPAAGTKNAPFPPEQGKKPRRSRSKAPV